MRTFGVTPGFLLFILGIALALTISHWFFLLAAYPIIITAFALSRR